MSPPTSPVTFRLRTASGRSGSAFLVEGRYALTAAHCVVGEEGGPEATVTLSREGSEQTAAVLWYATVDQGCDAALLQLTTAELVGTPNSYVLDVSRLPDRVFSRDVHWHSFGFPIADPEGVGLDLTGTIGGVQAGSGSGARRLQLTCDQFGADGAGLQGASGAPVTINGKAVGLISRSPRAFKQRVIYASLLDDVFAALFATTHETSDGTELSAAIAALKNVFATVPALELDTCDRALSKYLAGLRKRGHVVHERAIRTPLCKVGTLEARPLEETYVQATLHRISDVREFWSDNPACRLVRSASDAMKDGSLREVISAASWQDDRIQLLLTGEAGAGKTTVLQLLALKALSHPTDVGLPEPFLPLLISLPQLAQVESEGGFSEWLKLATAKNAAVCTPPLEPELFDTFPERLGVRWLLLFDGFDEVAELDRAGLYRSFRECVRDTTLDWVITSRPAASYDDAVIDISQKWSGVATFKLLPWSDDELRHFATALLRSEDAGAEFLRAFKFVALARSTTTPLLTLIAICVYEGRRLPRTKAELYSLFIDNAIMRALHGRTVPAWIREQDRNIFVRILARLAMRSVDDGCSDEFDALIVWAARELREFECTNAFSAKRRANEFIDFIAVASGLLLVDGADRKRRWRWWHATVRDYLGGLELAAIARHERFSFLTRWEEPRCQEVIIFGMAILSIGQHEDDDGNPDVTEMFQYLLVNYDNCGLLLYTALAEGAAVDRDTEEYLITQLTAAAIRLGEHPECEEYNQELSQKGRSPVELLAKLRYHPVAIAGLLQIRDTSSVGYWMRSAAADALRELPGDEQQRPQLSPAVFSE